MSELREFFEERKIEIEQFLDFISNIENDPTYNNNITIFKSQSILMTYNLIEGTVNKGIEFIFDSISDLDLKSSDFIKEIKIMWLRYNFLHVDDNGKHAGRLLKLENHNSDNVKIDSKEFNKNNQSYFSAGSLDSVSIKKILYKFNIQSSDFEEKLKGIKNDRNFLAHGEKSFHEVSKDKTVTDINDAAIATIVFLEKYVTKIETYISNENYKI